MLSFPSAPVRRFGVLAALLSLVVGLPAQAADEPDTGGIFTAPGYPLGTPVRNAIPGVGTVAGPGQQRAARPGSRPGARERQCRPAHRPRSERRLPAPRRAGAGAEAERVPALRRRRDRPAAADLRVGLLRRRRRQLPVARQRAGLGRLHDRPRRRDRDPRLGRDRRRLPQHGRSQRHAQPAQGGKLQRRRRQGRRPREEPARPARAPLQQLRPLGLARPAARPARLRRRPGTAAGSDHLVEPVDAALGGRRRRRTELDRLDAQDPAAARRQGHLRARRLRVPGPGRQVQGHAARRR